MNNSVIRDQQGILTFIDALESFITESNKLCLNMSGLLDDAGRVWRDDVARQFTTSFQEIVENLESLTPELRKRIENLQQQAALIGKYSQ